MEELQDAIEDAQYVNAISAHGNPIPTSKWDKPTEVGLEEWKNKKASQINKGDTPAFTPEWFMSQPIGFFLFAQFVKAYFDDYEQLNFMEDVIRFKKAAEKQRMEIATSIINNYLFPIKEGDKRVRNEIEHYDVARTNSIFSKEETKIMVCGSLDEFSRSSRIGVQGRLIKETRNIEKRNGNIPDIGIFDKIEAIVFYALISKYWHEYLISEEYDRCINFLWFQDREVVESDFYRIRVLGRGGFGLVSCKTDAINKIHSFFVDIWIQKLILDHPCNQFLIGVRKKASGKLYAMKVMNKKRIKMTKSEQLTLNECLVLRSINSPFVVNLKYSFQSNHDIFLILDLMTGGDLSFHLTQQGFFSKEMCIYYAARIILGIQALHDKEFVYRDLKPENCLLAEDGRMKLTDLGLSCKITPKLCGAAGTRGYWAPEMLRRDENGKRIIYGHAVDWFSFGCLLAELITGKNPFRTEAAVSFGKTKGSKKTSVSLLLAFFKKKYFCFISQRKTTLIHRTRQLIMLY